MGCVEPLQLLTAILKAAAPNDACTVYGTSDYYSIQESTWNGNFKEDSSMECVLIEDFLVKEMPKSFVVKADTTNPLWKKYIKWLNNIYSKTFSGDCLEDFYGYDGNKCDNCSRLGYFDNPTILTLEEWNEIVDSNFYFKLTDNQFEDVVGVILGDKAKWEVELLSKGNFLKANSKEVERLRELKVLDLWFKEVEKPVIKPTEKTVTLSNGESLLVKKELILVEGKEIQISVINNLYDPYKFPDTNWNFQINSFDIGCWKDLKRADLELILNTAKELQ
jgi:hypothetical protein